MKRIIPFLLTLIALAVATACTQQSEKLTSISGAKGPQGGDTIVEPDSATVQALADSIARADSTALADSINAVTDAQSAVIKDFYAKVVYATGQPTKAAILQYCTPVILKKMSDAADKNVKYSASIFRSGNAAVPADGGNLVSVTPAGPDTYTATYNDGGGKTGTTRLTMVRDGKVWKINSCRRLDAPAPAAAEPAATAPAAAK